jgi:hypothetical protein
LDAGWFNSHVAAKADNSGMWIRLTASPHRDGHHAGYGEGQSTRNSRFLELADVILSGPPAAKKKAVAKAVDSSKDGIPRKDWHPNHDKISPNPPRSISKS